LHFGLRVALKLENRKLETASTWISQYLVALGTPQDVGIARGSRHGNAQDVGITRFLTFFLTAALLVHPSRQSAAFETFGIEHAEAVAMVRGNGDVLHSCCLGEGYPGGRIEFLRIEELRQPLVLVDTSKFVL
jgi:hypothetical protein